MIAPLRRWHRLMISVLALVVAVVFTLAIVERPEPLNTPLHDLPTVSVGTAAVEAVAVDADSPNGASVETGGATP